MSHSQHQAVPEVGTCVICGEDAARLELKVQEFGYLHNGETAILSAQVPVYSCAACGAEYLALGAEDVQHEAVCHFLGRLSPAEIKGLRQELGLTQAQLANMTGIGVASIKRWEAGNIIQSLANDRQLRALRPVARERCFPTPRFRTQLSQEVYDRAPLFHLRPSVPIAA